MKFAKKHTDLEVYKRAFTAAMELFELSKSFPNDETYSLTDQMRRSSRSVTANLAEAWRKRKYEAAFINKLSDSEAEAAETQVWIQYCVECKYLDRNTAERLYKIYDEIIAMLVSMASNAAQWTLPK